MFATSNLNCDVDRNDADAHRNQYLQVPCYHRCQVCRFKKPLARLVTAAAALPVHDLSLLWVRNT